MSNLLKTGEQFLARMQTAYASERVDYARSEASVEVSAVRGRSDFDVTDASGAQMRVTYQDFIVTAETLALDGEPIKPKPGDRITDENGVVYEVSAPGPGVPHWVWAEPSQIRYRIHAKEVVTPT